MEVHLFGVSETDITIISFGADGDSRLLRAMKISSQLKITDKSLYYLSPSPLTVELDLPQECDDGDDDDDEEEEEEGGLE